MISRQKFGNGVRCVCSDPELIENYAKALDSYKNRLNSKIINNLIKLKDVTVISGYFMAPVDIHKGYQEYIKSAIELGNPVIAICSNKNQIAKKYGSDVKVINREYFLKKWKVDYTVTAIDEDGTVCKTLEQIKKYVNGDVFFYKDTYKLEELPEKSVDGIRIIIGKNPKIASSSELLGLEKK